MTGATGTDDINLGTLSYSITGDTDPLEQKLAELERERTLRLSLDLDDAAIASLNAKLQASVEPIRVTLDTSVAEAQLASLFGGVGGTASGGLDINSFASNAAMLSLPAYELQGMGYPRLAGFAPLAPLSTAAGVGITASAVAEPPSMAALEQASAQANVAEMTRAMQENAYANLASGDEASEAMTGAAAASRGGMGFRRMAGFYVAAKGAESLYTQLKADRDIEDIMHRSGTAEDNARDMLSDLRSKNEGLAGMGKGMLAGLMHFQDAHPIVGDLASGVIPEAFRMLGYSADDFDIDKQIQTLQKTERNTKENERRQLKSIHDRQHLDALTGHGDEMKESLGDEYMTTIDKGGVSGALARIDAAMNKRIEEINKLADQMEHSGSPGGHDAAVRYRESLSMLAKTTAGEQRQRVLDEDDRQLSKMQQHNTAEAYELQGQGLTGKMLEIEESMYAAIDNLNKLDPSYSGKVQALHESAYMQETVAFQSAYDRYSRTTLAQQDRITGIDAETAAVNRGSNYGELEREVSTIFLNASRQASDLRQHNDFGGADLASKQGIAELKLLQAQLGKNHGEAADPNYTYLGRGGSENDEIPNILRQINTNIENLQINLRITP